jgi:hypothetical protein
MSDLFVSHIKGSCCVDEKQFGVEATTDSIDSCSRSMDDHERIDCWRLKKEGTVDYLRP